MVFTVRIEGRRNSGGRGSGVYTVFYRSDRLLGGSDASAADLTPCSTWVPGLSPILVFRPI